MPDESTPSSNGPLLQVRDLRTYFPIKRGVLARTVGFVKAVDGVSFDIQPGKTLGLVGESGCGKTTVGRSILRLTEPTSGTVAYRGENFLAHRGEELRLLRRHMQIIFQDPVGSLNPRMRIGNIIGEPIQVHGLASGAGKDEMVGSLLRGSGSIPPMPTDIPTNFPAASGNASASPARWASHPISSFATNPFPRWTFPSRAKFSISWPTCARN